MGADTGEGEGWGWGCGEGRGLVEAMINHKSHFSSGHMDHCQSEEVSSFARRYRSSLYLSYHTLNPLVSPSIHNINVFHPSKQRDATYQAITSTLSFLTFSDVSRLYVRVACVVSMKMTHCVEKLN